MKNDFVQILTKYPVVRKNKNKNFRKLVIEARSLNIYLSNHHNKYIAYGSIGKGNWELVPWYDIYKVGTKIYCVSYTFCEDMSGFFISLNQQISYFLSYALNKESAYEQAGVLSYYWKEELKDYAGDFSLNEVSFNIDKSQIAKGFEKTVILSKYYSKEDIFKISNEELEADLDYALKLYDVLIEKMEHAGYKNSAEFNRAVLREKGYFDIV